MNAADEALPSVADEVAIGDADALVARLADPTRWSSVEVVASTGSTNADLAERARRGDAAPGSVRIAWHQASGRGRLDRVWTAPPGTSAAVSVLIDVERVPPTRWPWLSLAAGLAVVDGIAASTGVWAGLKWPNDVLVADRKLCGILAERLDAPDGARVVLGMGLNLTQTAEQLPASTATSLALAGAPGLDRLGVLAALLDALAVRLEQWRTGADALTEDYRAGCTTLGRDVVVHLPGGQVQGRARAVDTDGRLVLDVAGERRAFAVGDVVHVRPGRD